MKTLNPNRVFFHFSLFVIFLCNSCPFVFSAGALRYLENKPVLWADESFPVRFNIDRGELGPLSNAEAVELVKQAFQQWQDAPNSRITFQEGLFLPLDVNGTNYSDYLDGRSPGNNPIIFDDDGAIIRSLFGVGAENNFLGFGGPVRTSGSDILSAQAVFNGHIIERFNLSVETLLSTMLHEVGHFIGLDHSQLLRHLAYNAIGFDDQFVPIMLPTFADDDSFRTHLTREDRFSIASLYPTESLLEHTGLVEGVVTRQNEEVPGVNVIARRVGSVTDHLYSVVSGSEENGRGTFRFFGLPPGLYQLSIEAVDGSYYGSSSVGRYSLTRNSLSFIDPAKPQFYAKPTAAGSSRSEWSPLFVLANRRVENVSIAARSEPMPADESNIVLLGVDSLEAGGLSGFAFSSFQYLLEPSGRERAIDIGIQVNNPSARYDVIARKGRAAQVNDPALRDGISGDTTITLARDGDLPLERDRYFIAFRNLSASEFTFVLWVKRYAAEPTPIPTPTALEVNPALGVVGLDKLGGTFPRGAAVNHFDIGISDITGKVQEPGVYDGIPDAEALAPFLFIENRFYPTAKDMEFTGERDPGGNGSEGIYFLHGGNVGTLPPVVGRLGARGGPNRGGIDVNNVDADNINFGPFRGDFIPVVLQPSGSEAPILDFLVDIEPAGNNGFYALERSGKIFAEGNALEDIDRASPPAGMRQEAEAVDIEIFRGVSITLGNSLHSDDLTGQGAYLLDELGTIYRIGDAPAIDTTEIPLLEPDSGLRYHDLEFIPNPAGTMMIGLGVLRGDGWIYFAPFTTIEQPENGAAWAASLNPFDEYGSGFSWDIARDFEVEISDAPIYGLNEQGETIATNGRRVGILMADGYGGIHTGGRSTRYLAGVGIPGDDIRLIDGNPSVPVPVLIPYFGVDLLQDLEIAPPLRR